MDMEHYYNRLLAINSANLAANIENLEINTKLHESTEEKDRIIISLLYKILEEVSKNERK